MTYKFHMVGGTGEAPDETNFYFDAKQLVRIAMGADILDEAQASGGGYPVDDDVHLFILEAEPPNASLPESTVTFWFDNPGVGVKRLMVKIKDSGGAVTSGMAAIMT